MLYLSNNNTFTSNTVNSNLGNGIYLSSSMNNTMSSNTLTLNSGSAIYLASSHNNYLIENLLYQNPSNKDIELSYSNSNSGANNCAYFIPGTGTGNTVTCG